MIHRQIVVDPGPQSEVAHRDNPRSVIQVERHEDVVHRVQHLRVKSGALQVLTNTVVPPIPASK